jgi:hypothetical protein
VAKGLAFPRGVAVLLFAVACGSSSHGGFATAGDAGRDAEPVDAAQPVDGGSDVLIPDAGPPPADAAPTFDAAIDTGAPDAEDAGPIDLGPCAVLGGPCTTSETCLCGQAAGCTWDNVVCSHGTCQVAATCDADGGGCDAGLLLPPTDAGEDCCSICEYSYDTCAGESCLKAWLACNTACGAGQCPVLCAATLEQDQ